MRIRWLPLLWAAAAYISILSGCGGKQPSAGLPAEALPPSQEAAPAVSGAAPNAPTVPGEPAAAPSTGAGPSVSAPAPGSTTPASGAAFPSTAAAKGPVAPERSAAARRIGEIVYTEGTVLLHRGGAKPFTAEIGQVVEDFDVLSTGSKSRATLDLDSSKPGGSEIRMAENTVFYYESGLSDDGARKTALRLLAGSLALKVEKLADGEFRVGTDNAVLGVRGTTFIVNTVPDGALLVTCVEGRVEVEDDSGERLFAQPGRVVSQASGESVREELVVLDGLADYRVLWVDENLRSLEKSAPKVIAEYSKRYTQALPSFDAAYGKLKGQAAILTAWSAARDTGGQPRFTDWIGEKKTIAPLLFDCLSALFKLEGPFYRLQEFYTLRDRGIGAGTLPDGRSVSQFLDSFMTEAQGMSERLDYVRRALLLFKYVSAGSPLGQFFGAKADALGSGALFLED